MTEPRQIQIARSLIGIHEGDNPVITGFAHKIGELYPEMKTYAAGYTNDGIAWCGLFVAYCMAVSGMRPVFGPGEYDRFLWAQSWKQFGTATASPQIGDVLVLARHVTMYAGTRDGRYIGLGGNQSDSVKESLYSPDSVEAIRRPPIAADNPAYDLRPEIKIGATGSAVVELQKLLGFPSPTGIFDSQTDVAVRGFQSSHGLDVDGEVGYPQTWPALLGTPAPTPVPQPANVMTSKGSWYSQYDGKYHWHDGQDAPNSAALEGTPDDAQGIARPSRETLGDWYMVRAPNGKVSIEQQTDRGPGVSTGRTIDISAAAAERFGYSPQNFPTDSIFTFWPVDPPKEVAGLSKQQQAVKYRDLRKDIRMAEPQELPTSLQPNPKPAPSPQPQLPATNPLKQIDPTSIWQRLDNPDIAEMVIGIEVDMFSRRHPDRALYLSKTPPGTTSAPAAPLALQRPSVLLSAGTLGVTGLLQWLGHVPPPGAESLVGTLATVIPAVSTVLGGFGGWGAVASMGLNLVSTIARASTQK